MVFLITYDLNKADKDYDKLYGAIKSLGEHTRDSNLDSVWFVSTDYSVGQITGHLRNAMDGNDRLFVTRLRIDEYNGSMPRDIWSWIRARV